MSRTAHLMLLVACGLCVLSAAAQQTEFGNRIPPPTAADTEPQGPGAYYRAAGAWQPMEQIVSSGVDHPLVLFPVVLRARSLKFRGAEAALKIANPRPTFLLRDVPLPGGGSARDVVLVRFDKKKDHRDLPVWPGRTVFHASDALPKSHVTELTVTRESASRFTVTPAKDLQPGEYILTFGMGEVGGYDFEVLPSTMSAKR